VKFVLWCALATAWVAALPRTAAADRAAVGDVPRGQLRFRAFGAAEGLRNLVVGSIAQDSDGLLWVATDDGVYRLDGERFSHFSLAEGLLTSVSYVVGVAPSGEVCVGSADGLVCWDGARFSQANTRGMPAIPVHAMISYAGKLWVGTTGGGLYVQNGTGGFGPAPGWPRATATIRTMWADGRGLVVGDDAGVTLTIGNGVWRPLDDVGIEHERIDGVLRDRGGALWIRTASHMWFLPDRASRATDLHAGLPSTYDAVDASVVMAIGPLGNVLVATDVGIAYRDGERWQLIDRSVGLPASAARTLFVDHEGTLWIGSLGLLQLRGRGLVERHDVASGLPGDVVWAFQRDREGTLWAATSRCLAHATGGRWVCLPGTEGRIVQAFEFAPQGGVFVGGAPSDLLYVAPDGTTTSLGDFDHPADHNVFSIKVGPDGDLWLAAKLGLFRLPHARPGPLERVVIPGMAPGSRFMTLAIVDGNVWTASSDGVAVYDHGTWHLFGQRAGFRASSMSYVLARAGGGLCITYGDAIGLSCFRYKAGVVSDFQHIGPDDGLASGFVYFLGEDRERRLWVGTGNGVDVITPRGVDHFDERDGFANDDSSAMAFLVDPDGSLWMGSSSGATHLLAQHYDGPPRPPRTIFLSGALGDHAIHGAMGKLETPHDHNALMLEIASSSMSDAKRVEYQVRLSPLETAWSTTQRQARYPALQPGAYRFEARARIDAGAWGPTAALQFAVLPAWWQTRWFLALAGLAVLATIGSGVAWRQRAVMQRRLRQIHQQSDASFRAVIDLMPDLISIHRDGKLSYLNLASRRMLGIDALEAAADQPARDDFVALVHPDDAALAGELFRKVLAVEPQVASELVELRMRGADGSWRTCEVSAIVVDIGGRRTVVVSGRDVTERKRMRAKLLVSDRMASLGTLAAGIAHEINNPLAYVTGNLEVMAETLEEGEAAPDAAAVSELRTVISDARDGAERVRKIVLGLKSFSRAEEEKRVPIELSGVLEAAIRLTSNEVRHRAELVRELGSTPLVVADDARLTQVFINLLINAAHAIPAGRSAANRVTVRTRTDGDGNAVVEIEDSGNGMTPDVQARVFDPFFTTKDVGEGTGLGLSICHGIISGLGGQISIESSAVPPTRTVVRVVLPPQREVTAPIPVVASQSARDLRQAPRQRVMLVDDEPQVAQSIERLLRRDYDVTIALCGEEAIDHIRKGSRFDAIVSDVMMPNMTGIELVEELRRVAPDQAQRLIFLSGGVFTPQTRERLDEIGAPQLAKPVTAQELRTWVTRIASAPSGPAV
jgi:PAS domain S-box-containing protein